MTSIHYHAGWSLPGCLPEMDPATFARESEAMAWVESEERDVSQTYECECPMTFLSIDHLDGCDFSDPYTYWVEPCYESDCVVES